MPVTAAMARVPLDDLREAVTTLEDSERIARRVLGASHPIAVRIETCLRNSRTALRTREYRGPLVVAVVIAVVAAIDRGCRLGFWRGYY